MWLVFKLAVVLALSGHIHGDPICCTPDQWEALMFWDNGNAFIDYTHQQTPKPRVGSAYTYINGSLMTAYDYTHGRTYIQVPAVEISPLIPRPIIDNTTLLRDYKNGVQYQFSPGKCAKTKLDPLKRHCIPESAVNLGNGLLGKDRIQVSTYAYTLPDFPNQFQSTVTHTEKGCLPVHVMYFVGSSEADSGAVNSLEVSNITVGIKDPSIFTIPSQCRKAKELTKTAPKVNVQYKRIAIELINTATMQVGFEVQQEYFTNAIHEPLHKSVILSKLASHSIQTLSNFKTQEMLTQKAMNKARRISSHMSAGEEQGEQVERIKKQYQLIV
ncbi:hypothetical protein BaRGS_00000705 [Batillaria attramentaria]|uniref:Uncharacterized protein n=1 Tax=Batillaria attramentaria TaxID=370345 RepID=A0ABD0M728_9CAEN